MLWKNTYNELVKISARPRSYLGMGIITLLVAVIVFALKIDGTEYLSMITGSFEQTIAFEGNLLNGNLVAFIVLQTLIFQVPLLIALVTGDLVSGEAASGSLRMLASRPVSRTSVIISKLLAGAVYTLIILVWLGILALGLGRMLFGSGDLTVLTGDGLVIHQYNDVMWRFFCAFGIAYLALLTIATLSVAMSCFTDNSIGPIVSTMGIIILFSIIGSMNLPVFDGIKPYLFTTHMARWRFFFHDPVPARDIIQSAWVLTGHIMGLTAIALLKFNKKDILS